MTDEAGHPKVIGYGFHSHRLLSEGMPHELFRRLHRTRSDSPVWRSSDTNAERGSWSAVQVGSIRSFWIPGAGSGMSAGKPRTDSLVCASIARAMLDATGIAERHWFPARSAAVSSLIAEASSRRASVCISRRPLLWRRVIGCYQLRPDQVPVIRTKVATGNFAVCRLLDRSAVFRRELSLSVAPETHRLRCDAENRSHLRWASAEVNCFVDVFHEREFYTRRNKNQQLHLLGISTSVLV
jgi:hypothetical protein